MKHARANKFDYVKILTVIKLLDTKLSLYHHAEVEDAEVDQGLPCLKTVFHSLLA